MNSRIEKMDARFNLVTGVFTFLYLVPAWVLAKSGLREAQRLVSQGWGLVSCSHCGISFDFVKSADIYYQPDAAMFPLCKNCFKTLPVEMIDYYIDSLMVLWRRSKEQNNLEQISSNAKIEARRVKSCVQN